jgi:multidrug efflux pump subunit AcrA (membrane-fusion protein)
MVVVLGACGDTRDAPEAEEAHEAESASTRWAPVTRPTDLSIVEAPARVLTPPDASGEISPTFRARVVRVHVQPGERVEAGAPIVDVVAPDVLDAAAAYRSAGARVEAFSTRRTELDALRGEGLVERSRVFEVAAQLAEIEAERDRALAELRSAGVETREIGALLRRGELTLKSPVAGIVREVHAVLGEVREPSNEPLAIVVGEGRPRVEARFSGALPREVRFELVAASGERYSLAPTPESTLVVPEDGTTLAWFSLEDPAVLLSPGLSGRVRATTSGEGVVQVPAGALRGDGAEAIVVVRADGGEAREVRVVVLATSGTTALVRGEGIAIGDRVAADVASVLGHGEGDDH